MSVDNDLTQRQLMTIRQLIEAPSIEEASKNAKVSRPTIYEWLKNDAFKKELKRQRDEIINESIDKLKSAINKATDGLIKLINTDKDELKRLVCKDILEFAIRALEMERIEKRLDDIEQAVSGRNKK